MPKYFLNLRTYNSRTFFTPHLFHNHPIKDQNRSNISQNVDFLDHLSIGAKIKNTAKRGEPTTISNAPESPISQLSVLQKQL